MAEHSPEQVADQVFDCCKAEARKVGGPQDEAVGKIGDGQLLKVFVETILPLILARFIK